SSFFLSCALGTAPIIWSTTSPFLKISSAGILRMPYLVDVSELESTSTLPTLALPSYSPASSSTTGPTMRPSPHNSAQKSTSTGISESALITSSSKELSVISSGLLIITLGSLVKVKSLLFFHDITFKYPTILCVNHIGSRYLTDYKNLSSTTHIPF